MEKFGFADELSYLLMQKDKQNFLRRYEELTKEYSTFGKEYIELRLLNITYEFLYIGDFEQLYSKIVELEPQLFDVASDSQKIKLLVNKGVVLGRLNQFDEAIEAYTKALEYCNDDNLVNYKISVLTNIGVIYFREKDYISSLKYLLAAYDLNKKAEGQVKLTSLLVNIGLIYLQFNSFEKAIYFLELSLTTIPSSSEYARAAIYNNLIVAYSTSGSFDKAKKIIDLSKAGMENYSLADEMSLHRALALYYTAIKDYHQAIEAYLHLLSKTSSEKSEDERTKYKINMAKIYSDLGDFYRCKELIDDIEKHMVNDCKNKIYSYNDFLEIKISYLTHIEDYKSALACTIELINQQSEKYHSLEKQLVGELTNAGGISITDRDSNISFDAYEDKINELEEINRDLKDHEKLLVESLNDLKNESKIREKFISIISHDIRGPIGNIVQLLEILDEFDSQEEKDSIIKEVIDAMKQTYGLTNELVDWAKEMLDAQKTSLSYIDFKKVVNDIVLLYKHQLESKSIFIKNSLTEQEIIFAHETSVRTCFRNIIQNAIKYSEPYSKIEINQEIKSQEVIYSIKDYGRGMNPDEVKNLFDGKKISTLGTNEEAGIGIGLLLVKELVDKSNGKIRCESKLGEGTTFYLTFPIILNNNLN